MHIQFLPKADNIKRSPLRCFERDPKGPTFRRSYHWFFAAEEAAIYLCWLMIAGDYGDLTTMIKGLTINHVRKMNVED